MAWASLLCYRDSDPSARLTFNQKKHGPKSDGLLLTRDDHLEMERPN
jgi:hypothetical protein